MQSLPKRWLQWWFSTNNRKCLLWFFTVRVSHHFRAFTIFVASFQVAITNTLLATISWNRFPNEAHKYLGHPINSCRHLCQHHYQHRQQPMNILIWSIQNSVFNWPKWLFSSSQIPINVSFWFRLHLNQSLTVTVRNDYTPHDRRWQCAAKIFIMPCLDAYMWNLTYIMYF